MIINWIVEASFKIIIRGKGNVPDAPAALIVANHSSYVDVPVIGHALFHKLADISWVISKENYRMWFFKWLFFVFEVIVINGTVEKAKKALARNRWVVIFPEGGNKWCPPIKSKKRIKPAKGAAVIALSTGVPVIPVSLWGADKVLPPRSFRLERRYRITVRIGKPLYFPKVETSEINAKILEKTTQEIMDNITKLLEKGGA
jgi:1-acyl-sn-glycerol-3-phosphate acyltransferase